jgi:hypothetical protein
VELDRLVPGIIGAFVGVIGWLFVGMYIQRRQFSRQARSAARAVYFELDINRVAVSVAREFGSFTPLDRTSFERLLPELAALLTAVQLKAIVPAYMAHAGYQQASADAGLPQAVRTQVLDEILAAHDTAIDALRSRAFSAREAKVLVAAGDQESPTASTSAAARGTDRRTTASGRERT